MAAYKLVQYKNETPEFHYARLEDIAEAIEFGDNIYGSEHSIHIFQMTNGEHYITPDAIFTPGHGWV